MLNIIICGTPGTGKSSLIEKIKPELPGFNFVNLSQFAIDNDCIDDFDDALETHVIDEDKLSTKLKPFLQDNKQNIIECIHGDQVPVDSEYWFFVCRTDNTKLYDRLKARGYNESKISNNIQAEIFQLVHDEVVEEYGDTNLTQLVNDDKDDLDKNAQTILETAKRLLKKITRT